jgi:LmbE family N-acetylglucosaminyl deacetylase
VICAHADDEILGCAGTTIKHIQDGNTVNVLILAEGITSRGNKEDHDKYIKELEELKSAAIEINNSLGVHNIEFSEFPDNRMDSIDLLDIVKVVEKFIDKYKPEIIYTHHYGDLNIDHQLTYKAVMTATRPMENQCVKEIYTFEIPSSTEWTFDYLFKPNIFIDISDTLYFKLEALSYYESEMRKFPHPRSPEAIKANAQRWGSVVGCEAAEAFCLIRKVIK